jgi:hypothetical protein
MHEWLLMFMTESRCSSLHIIAQRDAPPIVYDGNHCFLFFRTDYYSAESPLDDGGLIIRVFGRTRISPRMLKQTLESFLRFCCTELILT